jgi:hypothetical protein
MRLFDLIIEQESVSQLPRPIRSPCFQEMDQAVKLAVCRVNVFAHRQHQLEFLISAEGAKASPRLQINYGFAALEVDGAAGFGFNSHNTLMIFHSPLNFATER